MASYRPGPRPLLRHASPQDTDVEDSIVAIVDDDVGMRESLQELFQSVHLRTESFESADQFLDSGLPGVANCLVLDIRLPGMSGLGVQDRLVRAGARIPIIFITGHADIPMSVQAMKAGAVDFLTKPFRDQDILDAVSGAIARDRRRRDDEKRTSAMRTLFEALSPRERQVMILVTSGLMNKQVAARTGLSEPTVKVHRGHAMRKMGAKTLPDLVRMAESLGLHRDDPGSLDYAQGRGPRSGRS